MGRYVASIEARMGSSRLPSKMMKVIGGQPALQWVVDRLRLCQHVDDIVVATSEAAQDDVIADWAQVYGVACFRGSEEDVLARVVGAQEMMNADHVVEICGDMIFLDPNVVDEAIVAHQQDLGQVVTTTRQAVYPDGMDAQVFDLDLLQNVAASIHDPDVREHVSLYFYQHPERYRIYDLPAPSTGLQLGYRFVLDEPSDLTLLCAIADRLADGFPRKDFSTEDIIRVVSADNVLKALAQPR